MVTFKPPNSWWRHSTQNCGVDCPGQCSKAVLVDDYWWTILPNKLLGIIYDYLSNYVGRYLLYWGLVHDPIEESRTNKPGFTGMREGFWRLLMWEFTQESKMLPCEQWKIQLVVDWLPSSGLLIASRCWGLITTHCLGSLSGSGTTRTNTWNTSFAWVPCKGYISEVLVGVM